MRIVSWNIHGCVGTDGEHNPMRVADVLAELAPDLIALQEVTGTPEPCDGHDGDLRVIARRLGFSVAAGPARPTEDGFFGNAILTRYAVEETGIHDISVRGREPRAVLSARIGGPGVTVQMIVTHFGLSARERLKQARLLSTMARNFAAGPSIVAGDFNEWRPRASTMSLLNGTLGKSPSPRTFPSRFPLLRLDRIWVNPADSLVRVKRIASRSARVASDHLPLLAETRWGRASRGS